MLALGIGPSSESALAQSMVAAIRDLGAVEGPQYIVVVTGGEDSCNPEAGELVRAEAERAGIDVQSFIVGFGVDAEQAAALKTLANATGAATYYEAADGAALRVVMAEIHDIIERGGAPRAVEPAVDPAEVDAPEEDEPDDDEPAEVAAEPSGETACDHPYFPLRQGAQFSYSSDGEPATWNVIGVSGDNTSATAQLVIEYPGGSITYDWTCGTDGVFHYQAGAVDFTELGAAVDLEITGRAGAPLPPASQFLDLGVANSRSQSGGNANVAQPSGLGSDDPGPSCRWLTSVP